MSGGQLTYCVAAVTYCSGMTIDEIPFSAHTAKLTPFRFCRFSSFTSSLTGQSQANGMMRTCQMAIRAFPRRHRRTSPPRNPASNGSRISRRGRAGGWRCCLFMSPEIIPIFILKRCSRDLLGHHALARWRSEAIASGKLRNLAGSGFAPPSLAAYSLIRFPNFARGSNQSPFRVAGE